MWQSNGGDVRIANLSINEKLRASYDVTANRGTNWTTQRTLEIQRLILQCCAYLTRACEKIKPRENLLYVKIKCQLDATEVFIADLVACSTCFGHHYAHHQELKSIIRWLLPVVFCAVVFKLLVWCVAECCVSGLQHPANRTHNLKTTARNTTGSNHCIILLSSWWWA